MAANGAEHAAKDPSVKLVASATDNRGSVRVEEGPSELDKQTETEVAANGEAVVVAQPAEGLESAVRALTVQLAAAVTVVTELTAALQLSREANVEQAASAARLVLSSMPNPVVVKIEVSTGNVRQQPAGDSEIHVNVS